MSEDIHTLVGAYALDAVDDLERLRFDRHLVTCPSCEQEVAELRATAGRLADLTDIAPPGSWWKISGYATRRRRPPRHSRYRRSSAPRTRLCAPPMRPAAG